MFNIRVEIYMKKIVKFLLVIFCLACSCVALAQDKQESQRYFATAKLNVRSAPNASAKILGGLSKGEEFEVYSIEKGWAKVEYRGTKAYVFAKYIEMAVVEEVEAIEEPVVEEEPVEEIPELVIDTPRVEKPWITNFHFRFYASVSLGSSNFYSFRAYSHPRFGFGLDAGTQITTDYLPKHFFSEASMGFMALGNSNYSFPSFMFNLLPIGYRDDLVGIKPLKDSEWFVVGGFSMQFSGGNISFYRNGIWYYHSSKPTINLYVKGGVELKGNMAFGIIVMHGINDVARALPIGIKHSVVQVYGTYYFDKFIVL